MKEITGQTTLTGLLGSPVSHSISPMMHNESFRQLDLDYVYLAFNVGVDGMESAVNGFRTLNVRGFNVTMPGKNIMATLCDKLSPAAEIIGAVNTVVNDNGFLIGHNTDGVGYMRAVQDAGHDIIGKKMTLLGAGGAATAVLVQAALDGLSEISIFSIHDAFFERAEKIVAQLNERTSCKVTLYDFEDPSVLRREISESAILTNGTSVGMAPNTDRTIITDTSMFHNDLIVSDVIYNPRETKLLRQAKKAGCQTFNGLYMLLYQGAEAFKLWTGQEMPVDLIKSKYFSE
jgi:shikimate dehydrogenase